MRLEGKVAIVTGGGQGIGRALALGLAGEGARVVVADIDFQGARETAEQIESQGGQAVATATDVSHEASTLEMAEKTVERFGRIDILVNNAALFTALGPGRPWHQLDIGEWDRVMAVNLRGMFLCCKAVFPQMKAQGKGKIINISSGSAYRGSRGRLHYLTSKAGVLGFTRGLAREVGEYNINVNTVAPGSTMTEGVKRRGDSQETIERTLALRCFRRIGEPEYQVGAVIFLASDESDFITGETIVVDGGAAMV